MAADLSALHSWFWILIGLVIAFVIVRYFLHVVIRIFHVVISFFWHGCITLIVLFVIYILLRASHLF
jgi:hypothetical protein